MSALGLPVNLLLFVFAAVAVWRSGTKLTEYVDAIAERRNLGRAFMGFLVLATATQLPEIVTNSTAALRGNATLVVNSMFGGIAMQTAVLAAADVAAAGYALTYLARHAMNLLQGTMLVGLLGALLGITLLGDYPLLPSLGLAPVLMLVIYLGAIRVLWRFQKEESWKPAEVANAPESAPSEPAEGLSEKPLRALIVHALAAAGVVLLAGVVLVWTAESIALQSGLGSSFIGVTLLASATSLPELSTALAAVRLGQYSMAVSDVFGSNLIMVALLLPSDLLYADGLILDGVDASARFALAAGVVVTAIYLTGLILRRPHRTLGMGLDSWAVVLVYAVALLMLFNLR